MDRRSAQTRPAPALPAHSLLVGTRPAQTGARAGSSPPAPLHRLVAAECAAEAAAAGEDPEELQQAVWLRLLEAAGGSPESVNPSGNGSDNANVSGNASGNLHRIPSARWVRAAVRAEARRARRRSRREVPLPDGGPAGAAGAEATVLAAEQRRLLARAVSRLPGPCPALMRALFCGRDLTYAEIADELGMSQGSVGPVRSRCLGCLRRMLAASDCVP